MVDESQGSAKKKMLTQWMRHQQLMRNDPMQKKKKRWGGDQGMHGPKKKFEDGSSLPHVGPAAFRRIKKRLA